MIVYEITATVRADLVDAFEKYMLGIHIPDLLATGFFSGARVARSGENRYRIGYEARDQKSLDEYLNAAAAPLRADFLAHFPEGVELSRENWEVLQLWKKD
ncbi:MAG TPA: DUF4286 family protein [Pyrinomonadaceae bacterium]|jgi:hypothetical protein